MLESPGAVESMIRSGADRAQEFVDAIGDEIRGLHGHIMPGMDFDVACAWDGFGHSFRERRRADAVETAADHEHGAPQPTQFALHVQARQHSVDRRVAYRIVAEPSSSVALKASDVAAELRRIAVLHRILDGEGHAGGLDLRDAF